MSRISTVSPQDATGHTAELFARIKAGTGRVPNLYLAIGTHAPDALETALALDAVIGKSSLSKQDIETIRLVVSEVSGCDYCLAAHMIIGKIAGLAPDAMRAVRAGAVSGDDRRDALAHFVRTLVTTHGSIETHEYQRVRDAGFTERQVIEIALVMSGITFTNLVNRINDTALDFPRAD
ncbi:carboxymuconolactone decarboxylase family protein [Pandoraea anhela]|uniref:Alkylhydroperoxidase n=1 Tax=Pandoraea anhela TaxID=2508295 RepID=A0A5E4XXZ9_9BURK|nr:carboxymuconolactone decarboxylase family protein [Pandoraea anhela]VVE41244.1 alkylhydroperoxidase [Pandoraea anhela]